MNVEIPKVSKKLAITVLTMGALTWLLLSGQITPDEYLKALVAAQIGYNGAQAVADIGKEKVKAEQNSNKTS